MNDPSKHVLEQFLVDERAQRLRAVLARRTDALTVVIDQIHHQHNISAVLRSADAFGIQNVHIVGEKLTASSGVSLGAERWLSLHYHATPESAVAALSELKYDMAILEPPHEERLSIPVVELPFGERLAVVFGNEKFGVSKEFQAAARFRAHIPMFGFVESFNISVAAAITLFCSTLSGTQPVRQPLPVSSTEAEKILDGWLRDEVRGAEGLLERLQQKE